MEWSQMMKEEDNFGIILRINFHKDLANFNFAGLYLFTLNC